MKKKKIKKLYKNQIGIKANREKKKDKAETKRSIT